jgi:hypothetical protein
MHEEQPKAYCLTIHVVGALRSEAPIGDKLNALMERISQALDEVFPGFLPGDPPVWVSSSELRDDWIRRGPPATKREE